MVTGTTIKHRKASPQNVSPAFSILLTGTMQPSELNRAENTHGRQFLASDAASMAELATLSDRRQTLLRDIIAGSNVASSLRVYLRNLVRISSLDSAAVTNYAHNDIPIVQSYLQSEDDHIQTAAVKVLEYCAFHHSAWESISTQGAITELVKLLLSPRYEVVVSALTIIHTLTLHKSVAEEAFGAGVIQPLMSLLSDAPELQRIIIETIAQVLQDQPSRSFATRQGIFEAMMSLLEHKNPDIEPVVINTLYTISSCNDFRSHPVAFHHIHLLIRLLLRDDPKLRVSVTSVLANITRCAYSHEDKAFLHLFLQDFEVVYKATRTAELLRSTNIKVLRSIGENDEALYAIIPMLVSSYQKFDDEATKLSTCDALLTLTKRPEGSRAAIAAGLPEMLQVVSKSSKRRSEIHRKEMELLYQLQRPDTVTRMFKSLFRR